MKEKKFLMILYGVACFTIGVIGIYILGVDLLLASSLPLLFFIGMLCGYKIGEMD